MLFVVFHMDRIMIKWIILRILFGNLHKWDDNKFCYRGV